MRAPLWQKMFLWSKRPHLNNMGAGALHVCYLAGLTTKPVQSPEIELSAIKAIQAYSMHRPLAAAGEGSVQWQEAIGHEQ